MRSSTVILAVALAVLCALSVTAAEQMPAARQMTAAVAQACASIEDISLQAQPRCLNIELLKDQYPGVGSIVEKYRFQWAVDASYRLAEAEEASCLTVLRMKSPLDAFGPFSVQRTKEASPVPVPTSAYWLASGLHVWRGAYYVRACIPRGGPSAQQKTIDLVKNVMSEIPAPDDLPALLKVLPWEARQVGQPKYELQSVLGLAFLKNGVTLEYTEGATKCRLVVMRYNTVTGAAEAYEALVSALAAEQQSSVEKMDEVGDVAVRLSSGRYGQCLIMREKGFLAAVLDYHDDEFAAELLRSAGTNIRTYLLVRDGSM